MSYFKLWSWSFSVLSVHPQSPFSLMCSRAHQCKHKKEKMPLTESLLHPLIYTHCVWVFLCLYLHWHWVWSLCVHLSVHCNALAGLFGLRRVKCSANGAHRVVNLMFLYKAVQWLWFLPLLLHTDLPIHLTSLQYTSACVNLDELIIQWISAVCCLLSINHLYFSPPSFLLSTFYFCFDIIWIFFYRNTAHWGILLEIWHVCLVFMSSWSQYLLMLLEVYSQTQICHNIKTTDG